MRIPDCRKDKDYNEKYLEEGDGTFILGFDACVDNCIKLLFENLDDYEEELAESMSNDIPKKYLRIDGDVLSDERSLSDFDDEEFERLSPLTKLLLTLKEEMLERAEDERNNMITSFIDNDHHYEEHKKKVDANAYKNPVMRRKEYIQKYENGEVPTCWTYTVDKESGKPIKIGHCPNGNVVIKEVD